MKNEINEQELREYIDVLISEFGFTIKGIAKDTGIARSSLSTWKNNPDGAVLFDERLVKLNKYVMYLLFGDGLQDSYKQMIEHAHNIQETLKNKRIK